MEMKSLQVLKRQETEKGNEKGVLNGNEILASFKETGDRKGSDTIYIETLTL